MKRAWLAQAICLAALAAAACNGRSDEVPVDPNETVAENAGQATEPLDLEDIDLPPMIERSPSYRCADGNALYIDVLTDENTVMVRDTRTDVPTRLTRDSAHEPFTGDGRTLTGTGAQITYSSPDRPSQRCIEGDA